MPPRFRLFAAAILTAAVFLPVLAPAQELATNAAPAPSAPAPTTPVDPSSRMIAAAIGRMNANDADGALDKLNQAIQLNPLNSGAYVLRASVYCQKKLWPQAEQDFQMAQKLAPTNVVLKFNVVEVKFMQKQFDAARPGFLALENDPDMGDFASYKVFLCDLAAGHTALAQKELTAFDKVDGDPSYYFGNAAWNIAHKNFAEARGWLVSASHIYPPRKNAYYAESLIYLGYLPLPAQGPAPAATTAN
jgi:Tfp pilus assembly protein PilF